MSRRGRASVLLRRGWGRRAFEIRIGVLGGK